MSGENNLGLSGHLTRAFIRSPLTPLILLTGLALGLIALAALPREEEPQISVPMVDIFVNADGLKAEDAVRLVTEPLETIVKAINGVEHVYSNTEDDRAVVTARFLVGTTSEDAILRVHEKVRANYDRIPHGIPEPLIVGRGIDDVAIVTLTLTPKPGHQRSDDNALYQIAQNLQVELAKLENVGLSYIVGGRPDQIRVEPDPERLASYGITLAQLVGKVKQANRSYLAGRVRHEQQSKAVAAGQTLQGIPDIGLLQITARDGRPVYLRDVANIAVGAKPAEHQSWNFTRDANGTLERRPAVTLALAKRAGANAVVISEHILERLEQLKGSLIPEDIEVAVTRNYGETANEKANELLFHLALATVSIVLLVGLAIGWREGAVVMIVIPTTILLTLFASWLLGYTINRVSLFRADLLHRHPRRRRHRRDRKHRPALGHARWPRPGARRHRRGRGSRQSDHRRHRDRCRRPAAHAVRIGVDGSLHEPHPRQRLGGHDPVVLRRRDGDALADAQDQRRRTGPRRR